MLAEVHRLADRHDGRHAARRSPQGVAHGADDRVGRAPEEDEADAAALELPGHEQRIDLALEALLLLEGALQVVRAPVRLGDVGAQVRADLALGRAHEPRVADGHAEQQPEHEREARRPATARGTDVDMRGRS